MRMHIKHIMAILVTFLLYSILSGEFVHSRINPASSYCNSLGYRYIDGECIISDTEKVDAWDFIKGKAAQEHSFCAKQGYEIRTIKDREKCAIYGTEECAVCVLPGEEKEVSKFMNISFVETSCGDQSCGIPENSHTCPEDCPKGGFDRYCDEGMDDPDCVEPLTEEVILKEYEEKKMAEKETEEAKQKEMARKKLIKNALLFSIGLTMLAGIIFIAKKLKKGKIQESKKDRSK